jgi:hypothetical protein
MPVDDFLSKLLTGTSAFSLGIAALFIMVMMIIAVMRSGK